MENKKLPLKVEDETRTESYPKGKYKAGKHSRIDFGLDDLGSSYFSIEYSDDDINIIFTRLGKIYVQSLEDFIKNSKK